MPYIVALLEGISKFPKSAGNWKNILSFLWFRCILVMR